MRSLLRMLARRFAAVYGCHLPLGKTSAMRQPGHAPLLVFRRMLSVNSILHNTSIFVTLCNLRASKCLQTRWTYRDSHPYIHPIYWVFRQSFN